MKLLYCAHCGDIVRLYPEKRSCQCGKSWGHYLEDGATTVQTYPGLSLGLANPDFETALKTFVENPRYFSPVLAIRCWVNPLSESDVKFVPGESMEEQPHETSSDVEEKHDEQRAASGEENTLVDQKNTEDFGFLPTLQECLRTHPLSAGSDGLPVRAQEEVIAGLVRRLGGQPVDYLDIASWFYRPGVLLDNLSFFRLLGNSFGIFLAEQRFGISTRRLSDGKEFPTRVVAETLVLSALDCIPTLAHFFKGMAVEPWMSRGARPLSAEFAEPTNG